MSLDAPPGWRRVPNGSIVEGSAVLIKGLKGQGEWNGLIATVLAADKGNKFKVEFKNGAGKKLLWAKNLELVVQEAPQRPKQTNAADSARPDVINPTEAGGIDACQADSAGAGRFSDLAAQRTFNAGVEEDSDEKEAPRLQATPLESPGDVSFSPKPRKQSCLKTRVGVLEESARVVIRGLKTQPELNELTGTLTLDKGDRWQVRLDIDGKQKLIKVKNLELLDEASDEEDVQWQPTLQAKESSSPAECVQADLNGFAEKLEPLQPKGVTSSGMDPPIPPELDEAPILSAHMASAMSKSVRRRADRRLQVGLRVRLRGLRDRPEYEAAFATVVAEKEDKWLVRVEATGDEALLRGVHLDILDDVPESPSAPEQPQTLTPEEREKRETIIGRKFRRCKGRCGFLCTWHISHCCYVCAEGGEGHGVRCERILAGDDAEEAEDSEEERADVANILRPRTRDKRAYAKVATVVDERSVTTPSKCQESNSDEVTIGTRVSLKGTKSKPELSGALGTVKRAVDGGKWFVQLDGEQGSVIVKTKQLVVVRLKEEEEELLRQLGFGDLVDQPEEGQSRPAQAAVSRTAAPRRQPPPSMPKPPQGGWAKARKDYFIIGSWSGWEIAHDMHWDKLRDCYTWVVELGPSGLERFQIIKGTKWGVRLYPDEADGSHYDQSFVCGPDGDFKGLWWCIGKHSRDRAAEGMLYEVRLFTKQIIGNNACLDWIRLGALETGVGDAALDLQRRTESFKEAELGRAV